MKRTLVIGDIHGGLKALKQVLERASVTEDDLLIFLGDYVDGWSESAQVIQFLMELSQRNECIFIKGNHDAWCEDWLIFGNKPTVWVQNGGKETIDSYLKINEKMIDLHADFFQSMKNFYVDDENRLFIHAGFSSMHGPERETYSTNYSWDRTLWEVALSTDPTLSKDSLYFPKRLNLFKEIYIGHTPTIHYNETVPMNRINVWNIDTGAAFTGKVSILDIETKEFWQSDSLPELYPDETGRNFYKVKQKK